jgi:hypothetical protein
MRSIYYQIGSRVTVIMLNGWLLPIDEALLMEGPRSMRLPYLVYLRFDIDTRFVDSMLSNGNFKVWI